VAAAVLPEKFLPRTGGTIRRAELQTDLTRRAVARAVDAHREIAARELETRADALARGDADSDRAGDRRHGLGSDDGREVGVLDRERLDGLPVALPLRIGELRAATRVGDALSAQRGGEKAIPASLRVRELGLGERDDVRVGLLDDLD